MIIPIRTKGNVCLTTSAVEVPHGTSINGFINDLWDTMYYHKGIGLAANQVGQLKRVIVVHVDGYKQAFINPVIAKSYGGKTTAKEGCLSVPAAQVTKVRHKQIIVEGFDENWKPIRRKLKGLAARCVQHEIDHLNGIII